MSAVRMVLRAELRARWRAWLAVAVTIPAALLLANLVAALPGRAASKTRAALVLRAE